MDTNKETLEYDQELWEGIWQDKIPHEPNQTPKKMPFWQRLHLLFTFMVFLDISLALYLDFMFTSHIQQVCQRVRKYLQYYGSATSPEDRFAPAWHWQIWHQNVNARPHLHDIVEDCAKEIALDESDKIITDSLLKIKMKELTNESILSLLSPRSLYEKYCQYAPFTTGILHVFTNSPNHYRKHKEAKERSGQELNFDEDLDLDAGIDDTLPDSMDPAEEGEDGGPSGESLSNSEAVIRLVIAMLTYLQNCSTNLLPLFIGLFFVVNGTHTHVIEMLHNIGLLVSVDTLERLKEQISNSAIDYAIDLMASPGLWFIIFDNINIYLWK
ncbi:hypothetical protein BT96DRAFT_997626 [Gymnopus androsaceus JB14]|uniref:Uncharacterized protein n=1 Tax=Gymnopus androsaceus JB14 TaxID=1447944 RepID=A0A6A4HCZ1_9AGAR|nr:hypothetical protein BT96DRAFT_997626 [Gymnopus androsaceus JB14]